MSTEQVAILGGASVAVAWLLTRGKPKCDPCPACGPPPNQPPEEGELPLPPRGVQGTFGYLWDNYQQ